MTTPAITSSVSSLSALSARVHGPWQEARSILMFRYTCAERVPLEIKWACSTAGNGEVFTLRKCVAGALFHMLWYVAHGEW